MQIYKNSMNFRQKNQKFFHKKNGSVKKPLIQGFSIDFQRFGLMVFHSLTGGTMPSVTSSSRILQRCS